MSLFLGKIHYWLFNKILWFENLEDEIIKFAEEQNLDIADIKNQIEVKYGKKIENKNLEEIIDTQNIHGWLQNRIYIAESKMAKWTNFLIENGKFEDLENIYISQAKKVAAKVKDSKDIKTATEIYECINDYILDGMPCDRVNEVTHSSEEAVQWKRRICVHKDIWEKEDVDVNIFYRLRSLWIREFVHELNDNFKYIEFDDIEFCISKK